MFLSFTVCADPLPSSQAKGSVQHHPCPLATPTSMDPDSVRAPLLMGLSRIAEVGGDVEEGGD